MKLEVVEMRELFEESAKAVSLVASRAFSRASLFRASGKRVYDRRPSIRLLLYSGFALLPGTFCAIPPISRLHRGKCGWIQMFKV